MAEEKPAQNDMEGVSVMTEEQKMAGCGVCCPPDPDVLGCSKYDYKWLCTPQLPCAAGGVAPPLFLGKDERLPLLLAVLMGLQHSLAMLAGIATSGGLLIAGDACFPWQYDSKMCEARPYLVSAAWITSGLLTTVQVFRAKILGTGYYLGTGLISVMGTSFTFLPIAREMVVAEISQARADGKCIGNDCQEAGLEGYGKFLGTCMVASVFEMIVAMLPPRILQKIFPPVVTGTAVLLIGGGLIGSGIKYMGGGVFCAEHMAERGATFGGPQLCQGNGEVALAFGAKEYIGLSWSVIIFTLFLQFVGSPFLKSTSLFFGLMFGVIVSLLATYEAGPGDSANINGALVAAVPGKKYYYWTSDKIDDADTFTFLWANDPNPLTFLGFAPEYFLPILIGFFISTAETVGDVGLSCQASQLPSSGPDFDARVQGGLLADGLNSLIAGFFTSPPNTTFSQNNGIISLTRCASRAAGFACSFWLILFGVIAKFGNIMASIPDCVIGGLTFLCFSMVFVGGIKILAGMNLDRRTSLILTIATGMGMGVAMEPHLFDSGAPAASFYARNLNHIYGFWPKKDICDVFPDLIETTPASCLLASGQLVTPWPNDEAGCTTEGGTFTAAFDTNLGPTENCIGNNGNCCVEINESKRMWRTSIILVLKTPYCIGTVLAVLLNFILPNESQDEKDQAKSEA
mmetsp:Transcript_54375/g.100428  ORF Transcript_54375/g.100428 Transcript_54375/m.100428 type:complete len:686 (-) Transcript_54375:308-2365(-)